MPWVWTVSGALSGRAVNTGSVFSTILISFVVHSTAYGGGTEQPTRLVVDVGCGDSPYRSLFDGAAYVGVDRATSEPARNPALDHVVTGDVLALPLASEVADAVLCTEVIEHVPDERQLASELARVAAPGATLVLSAPFVHGLHEQPYDFRRLTSIGLVSVLSSAGWEVAEVAAIGGPLVVLLDGVLRSFDSGLQRVARRLARRGSTAHSVLTAPSRWVQVWLAGLVLRRSRFLGPIDPFRPVPRLTLGYVVRATRRGPGVTAATNGTPRRTAAPAD